MTLSPENIDTEFDSQRILESYELMYLIRKPSYKIFLTVSKTPATHPHEERPLLYLCFKD